MQWNAGSNNQEWYVYDTFGNRVLRRSLSSNGTSMTVYAFGLEEHGYDGTGNNQSNVYYYVLGNLPIGELNGTNTPFFLTDALGSILSTFSATSGSAAVQGNQVYGPYGNNRYSQGAMGTSKGFTGQYNDSLTGLDYYNARYYDPVVGRFLTADTVQGNLGGMDPYAYVEGNPETLSDPTGNCDATCYSAIALASGTAGVELGPFDLVLIGVILTGVAVYDISQNLPSASNSHSNATSTTATSTTSTSTTPTSPPVNTVPTGIGVALLTVIAASVAATLTQTTTGGSTTVLNAKKKNKIDVPKQVGKGKVVASGDVVDEDGNVVISLETGVNGKTKTVEWYKEKLEKEGKCAEVDLCSQIKNIKAWVTKIAGLGATKIIVRIWDAPPPGGPCASCWNLLKALADEADTAGIRVDAEIYKGGQYIKTIKDFLSQPLR